MESNAIVLKNRRKSAAGSSAHKRKAMAIARALKAKNATRYRTVKKLTRKLYRQHEHSLALAREKIAEQRSAHEKLLRAQKDRLNGMLERRDAHVAKRPGPHGGAGRWPD